MVSIMIKLTKTMSILRIEAPEWYPMEKNVKKGETEVERSYNDYLVYMGENRENSEEWKKSRNIIKLSNIGIKDKNNMDDANIFKVLSYEISIEEEDVEKNRVCGPNRKQLIHELKNSKEVIKHQNVITSMPKEEKEEDQSMAAHDKTQ